MVENRPDLTTAQYIGESVWLAKFFWRSSIRFSEQTRSKLSLSVSMRGIRVAELAIETLFNILND